MATSEITNVAQIKQLSDGGSAGTCLGQSATDLVSFHGATPCDKSPVGTALDVTAPVQISSFGFVTSAQFTALLNAVNACLVCLKEKGLMATS
jgi:hypothetical protein